MVVCVFFVLVCHFLYTAAHFHKASFLKKTADRTNFQGRYVLRHPWTGNDECPATEEYRRELAQRHEQDAQQLADLTGWDIADIPTQMNLHAAMPNGPESKTWAHQNWNKSWLHPTRNTISPNPS